MKQAKSSSKVANFAPNQVALAVVSLAVISLLLLAFVALS
jgi:hypothetical protein